MAYFDNTLLLHGTYTAATNAIAAANAFGSAGTAVNSTNVVDLGTARDVGEGQPVFLRLLCGTTFINTSATTQGPVQVQVDVVGADDANQNSTSNTQILDTLLINCNPTVTTATGATANNLFSQTNHGLAAGTPLVFSALTGGSSLATATTYYVINPTASTFQLTATQGSATVQALGSNVTAATYFTQQLVAGNRYALQINPKLRSVSQRYLWCRFTSITTASTAGTFIADVGAELQDGQKFYANGFSVL